VTITPLHHPVLLLRQFELEAEVEVFKLGSVIMAERCDGGTEQSIGGARQEIVLS